ncbi:hypothetical protein CTheo_7046 [Ceratobasidium theobromae]|uniref:Uncharacterized protein n=1 Tax=Ceratobasidium theobromae TaxID=1582974 RepID=A0A5N5QD33_9AGAM|nr:hypothetical protein CTheo_7046 [Ceratobasidium theobromae]
MSKFDFSINVEAINFRARQQMSATVEYVARLAFGISQINRSNIVEGTTWVEAQSEFSISIIGDAYHQSFYKELSGSSDEPPVCWNEGDGPTDVCIGFVKGNGINQRYEKVFVWSNVPPESCVYVKLDPVIPAYVIQCGITIGANTGDIRIHRDEEPIWTANLDDFGEVTGWNFIEDDEGFTIEPASVP